MIKKSADRIVNKGRCLAPLEKRASDLDNLLEAKQGTKFAISRLINEGDPNTQILVNDHKRTDD